MEKNLIEPSVEILEKGGVLIIPTETVYGIAVDATNKLAIDKIYEIKNRKLDKPLQIMCGDYASANNLARFSAEAEDICKKCWGSNFALTAILNKKEGCSISSNFNQIDDSIGIRVSNHEFLNALLASFNKPLATTSANLSGEGDALALNDINKQVIDRVDFAIDGGACKLGKASSVVDFRGDIPLVVRRGGYNPYLEKYYK